MDPIDNIAGIDVGDVVYEENGVMVQNIPGSTDDAVLVRDPEWFVGARLSNIVDAMAEPGETHEFEHGYEASFNGIRLRLSNTSHEVYVDDPHAFVEEASRALGL